MAELNSYALSRSFFDFSFENPEKISTNHVALFFFAIEHCNRLGWKQKFGFPSGMAMDAIGIKSYNTFIKVFKDLTKWGFFIVLQKSKNQYSANIIALSKYDKALDKALDKAMIKHCTKHLTKQSESTVQSTVQSNDSIIKHRTIEPLNNKPINKEQEKENFTTKKEGVFSSDNLPQNNIQEIIEFLKNDFQYFAEPDEIISINGICKKIEKIISEKNKSSGMSNFGANKKDVLEGFKMFINNLDDFNKKNNFQMSYLNQNFQRIYQAIKNENKNGNAINETDRRILTGVR